jgi:hypothetical protein
MNALQLFLFVFGIGGVACAVTWVITKRRLERSWKWRVIMSLLIGTTIAPTCVPVLGQISVGPAVVWAAILLSDGGKNSSLGLLYGVLPIVVASALVFLLWSFTIRRQHQHENLVG